MSLCLRFWQGTCTVSIWMSCLLTSSVNKNRRNIKEKVSHFYRPSKDMWLPKSISGTQPADCHIALLEPNAALEYKLVCSCIIFGLQKIEVTEKLQVICKFSRFLDVNSTHVFSSVHREVIPLFLQQVLVRRASGRLSIVPSLKAGAETNQARQPPWDSEAPPPLDHQASKKPAVLSVRRL